MFRLKHRLLAVAVGMSSLTAFAGMSPEHLESRLNELTVYRSHGLDLDVLQREAAYESLDLTLDQRANSEAQILVQSVRSAVLRGYQAALEETGSVEEASQQVRINVERDMHLVAPELQADMKMIVEDVLRNPVEVSQALPVSDTLLSSMKERSKLRQQVLEQAPLSNKAITTKAVNSKNGLVLDLKGIKQHETKTNFVNALADDQSESERWVATSNVQATSGISRGHEEEISMQVSAEFLGVKVAAGPVFTFKKYITSAADFKGEGLYPIFDSRGSFDFILRDKFGNPKKEKGKIGRRYVMMSCNVTSSVESEAALKGGFKVAGVGAEGKVVEKYTNSVLFESRRVLVPDTIDGRAVTVGTLAQICHRDFPRAVTSNGRTVKQNLDTMIRNLISGLTYVNPSLKCVTDAHCVNWYNKEVIWMHKYNTTPKCVQERNNPSLMTCQLRGVQGAACAVYDGGKRVSSGMFEYTCNTGYKCVITHKGGWFQNWELWDPWRAECRKK